LLDWLNTQPQDRRFAQSQIAEYLRRIPPGTPTAAFVLGSRLHMVKSFTSDTSALLAALASEKDSINNSNSSSLLASATQDAAERQMVDMMSIMQTAQAGIEAVREEQSETRTSNTSRRISITLQAMQELARYLSGLPGRKNVIWFSSAFPVNLFPDHDVPRQYAQQLKHTADLLAQSRVAVYPVSTTGLNSGFSPEMGPPSQSRAGNVDFDGANGGGVSNQIAMEELAQGTGGKAFYNTNGIADALSHAVALGSQYYTLTYTPLNAKLDGRFRKIDVKVRKRGYKVACRRGYYALDSNSDVPTNGGSPASMLAHFVSFGTPDIAQIPFNARVTTTNLPPSPRASGRFAPNTPLRRYLVDFSVPLAGLSIQASAEGVYRDSLSMLVAAYDLEGKLLNVTGRKVYIALQLADYARARQEGLQLHEEIDAPLGSLFLRTGIMELSSSNVGTLSIPMSENDAVAATAPSPPARASDEHRESESANRPAAPESPAESSPLAPGPASAGISSKVDIPKEAGDASRAPIVGPPCQIGDVLPKVANHMKEFVEDMNHFTATETSELEFLDRKGNPHLEARTHSDYVVDIQNAGDGNYTVSEYRDIPRSVKRLAGGLKAEGTAALAMIFHPMHLEEFAMTCGNLVNLHGNDVWEIHFRQRMNRTATIANFQVGQQYYPLLLRGTAWFDSSNDHLIHLETDLMQSIPEAKLDLLHQSVDYGPIPFPAHRTTLWLPKKAEITVEFQGKRLRERRSYSDFRLFSVNTGEKIEAPKQLPQ
jgi:VWFA-related protein